MKTISIPYYTSTLDLHVDEANLKAVVTAKMHEYKAGKTEVELVHEALEHPIAPRACVTWPRVNRKLCWSPVTTPAPSPARSPCPSCWMRSAGQPGRRVSPSDCHRPAPPHHRGRASAVCLAMPSWIMRKSPSTTHLTRISSSTWVCCPPVRTSTSTSWPLNVTCW